MGAEDDPGGVTRADWWGDDRERPDDYQLLSEAEDLAIYLQHELKDLGARIRNRSITTSSIYMKFDLGHARFGSLRIGDHRGRRKYRYKWNLLHGYEGPRLIEDRGVRRRYYAWREVNEMVADMRKENRWKFP